MMVRRSEAHAPKMALWPFNEYHPNVMNSLVARRKRVGGAHSLVSTTVEAPKPYVKEV